MCHSLVFKTHFYIISSQTDNIHTKDDFGELHITENYSCVLTMGFLSDRIHCKDAFWMYYCFHSSTQSYLNRQTNERFVKILFFLLTNSGQHFKL